MEQQYKFQQISQMNLNFGNTLELQARMDARQNQHCLSHQFSKTSNSHHSCHENQHSYIEQQSSPSSIIPHSHNSRYLQTASRNLSKCLQQVKSKLQKTDEFGLQSYEAEKSHLECQEQLLDTYEEGSIEPSNSAKLIEGSGQKMNDEAKAKKQFDFSCFNDINTDNVIDLLQSSNFAGLKCPKNYSTRKELVACKLKLKDILLSKYKLYQIPKNAPPSKSNIPVEPQIKKNKKKLNLKVLLVRKLHKIIKKNNNKISSKFYLKSAQSILEDIQNNHGINSNGFRRSYTKILRQINYQLQSMSQQYKNEQFYSNFETYNSNEANQCPSIYKYIMKK